MATHSKTSRFLRRWTPVVAIGLSWGIFAAVVRFNLTDSEPKGVYVFSTAGSYVRVCPPDGTALLYRPYGFCHDHHEALLKQVGAVGGDFVTLSPVGIAVNGHLLPNTAPRARDSQGRPLRHYPYGDYTVPSGQVWLVSTYTPLSFDSRYFGPSPESAILERWKPLWIK